VSGLSVPNPCDQLGNCAPGIRIHGVFCPTGGTAPTEEECPEEPAPEDPGELTPFDIVYTSNFNMNMTSNSPFGVLHLYRNGSLQSNIGASFTTIGNTQYITDPVQLQNNVEAAMTGPAEEYSFELQAPTIAVSTNAPEGTTVALTATITSEGSALGYAMMTYIADSTGGPPSTSQGFGGPN
jgi:hypothetical protein